ncbi:MAG: hypothetical protein AB7T63_04505 [Planctomycetota bacterium]
MSAGSAPSSGSWLGRVARRLRAGVDERASPPGGTSSPATQPVPVSPAVGAMDVKAFVNPEERLLLLERAVKAWQARRDDPAEAHARREAALARSAARPVAGPVLLLGADRGWARVLASGGADVTVVDLAPEAREAFKADTGEGVRGELVVRPHAWLLHALDEASFTQAVLPRPSLAATSPPLAIELVRMAARVLRRDGLLYVEAAVHRDGHAWRARTELAADPGIDPRHVLPAADLFAGLAAERVVPLDVRELPAPPGEVALSVLARRTR